MLQHSATECGKAVFLNCGLFDPGTPGVDRTQGFWKGWVTGMCFKLLRHDISK